MYRIYPISSGKPSTPTVLGHFRVYRRTPGYLPDGMYFSSFFYGGYAIHGYNPAPDYPASHGCMRLPIIDAISVYNWLNFGDVVDVYRLRVPAPADARQRLLDELRAHALVIGEVVLTSGATAQYLVDAKRAILRRAGFAALAELVAHQAARVVGDGGRRDDHGRRPDRLRRPGRRRRREGVLRPQGGQDPRPGAADRGPAARATGERCMLVEDVVTTGGSTIQALEAVRAEGHEVCGVLAICDRLAGGG